MRLADQVAVVTGASKNIGGALAGGLAEHGAKVVCTDINPDVAREVAQRIVDAGGQAVSVAGDVSDPAHAEEAIDLALSTWGRVDTLVNNAVTFDQRGLLDMPIDAYRRQVDIVLAGSFLFSRAAARAMIEGGHGGSIINVLSTAAWQGQPGNIGYSTAKSGMINFTRSVAMELAEYDIRVNGFTPTATQPEDPDLVREFGQLGQRGGRYPVDFTGQMPMSRLPTPADYVGAVVFLASKDSAMITGTNITVDGGATAKYWPWVPTHS